MHSPSISATAGALSSVRSARTASLPRDELVQRLDAVPGRGCLVAQDCVNDLQLLPTVILDPPAVEMLFHESIAEGIEGAQQPAVWRSEASARGRNATNVSGFVTQRPAWRHHRETNDRQFPPSKEADEAFMRAREPRR